MVAGVRYDNHPALIEQYVRAGDGAYLKRDRSNKHSRHATEVRTQNGVMVGFVPEFDAADVAPLLAQGCRYKAGFVKVLSGGRTLIPVVQTYSYGANATVEGALSEAETPTSRKVSAPVSGSLPWIYVGIGVVVVLLAILSLL